MSLKGNRRFTALLSATTISNLGDGAATVAYPWLASAVTRNPVLIAMVMVAQRLPWLVFTLPAGVITDRVDRRRAMMSMDFSRAALTAMVAVAVLMEQDHLPDPGNLDEVTGTRPLLYGIVLVCTMLLGMAEVLRDNSSQTLLPALVDDEDLEAANGRAYSAEMVTNTFLGPPLGSLLLGVAFCLPFFLDAASFFAAAALVATIRGTFRAPRDPEAVATSWKVDLKEGFRWLWGHDLLRPMCIILGFMNLAAMVSGATFVLFAQEVLDTSPFVFAILGFGGALGGVTGGLLAPRAIKRFGSGTCLALVLLTEAIFSTLIGFVTWWPAVMVCFALGSLVGILWNVITVSLRQSIIPEQLLGRVNSVYRFFAWGMMPIGAALGGLIVVVVGAVASREVGLQATWMVNGAIHLLLFVFGRQKLTTAKIEAARGTGSGAGAPEPLPA